jgi:galactokinase/mevalonate kinase-like predicted kinase
VGLSAARPLACSAPARANLIGNPSDQYGGCTLACTVPLRARVELEPADGTLVATAGEERRVEGASDLALRGDRFDVARAVLAGVGPPLPRARIRYATEVPLGSGLAGSTALVVALLRALQAWRGEEPPTLHLLAEQAREIERRRLGVTCGYVDPYLCVFGGLRHVEFAGKTPEGSFESEPFATVETVEAPLPFVLAFTGRSHSSDGVHRPIRARWLAGEPDVRHAMERSAELGRLGKRALLLGAWDELGRLMSENHRLVRAIGGSGASNERLIEAALAAGALGAKLAGAGDGGTVVALWTAPDAGPLEAALRRAGAAALYRPSPQPGVRLEAPAGSAAAS